MDRTECRRTLLEEGVREDAFDLNGGHLPERYTIGKIGGMWRYYYSERGNEVDRRDFATESEACEHLLSVIRAQPATRMK